MLRFPVIRIWAVGVAAILVAGCGGSSGTPPQLAITGTPPAGTVGFAYPSFAFTASGGGVAPFNWTTDPSKLPPGLALSAGGQVSGTPSIAGTYPVSVTVADSSSPALTTTASVSLVINDTPIVIATSPTPPAGTVSYVYPGFGFSASGGSAPYTWKATGTLPPGLTLAANGSVSGTPSVAGPFPFTVTATDSAQTPVTSPPFATQILVNMPPSPMINLTPVPPAGTHGTPYSFAFSATGGLLPLSWTLPPGSSLPPGLSLGADGSLTGTPTTVGPYSFTVMVTESAPTPRTNTAPFSITVTDPPPPTINGASPPVGTVGVVYAPFQFTASNGLAPLVWSESPLLSGVLPGLGVDLSGLLSGTPSKAGHVGITLNATDALMRPAPSLPVTVRVSSARAAAAFTPTAGSMMIPRSGHTATLLVSGKVLVAGGPGATAELYDPVTGMFTVTGPMTEARSGHTATLLANSVLAGEVLIIGPVDQTAELYNPASGTFAATGTMTHARQQATATLLPSGKVLVAGGNTGAGDLAAELYDPATGTFAATGNLTVLRSGHTATLLPTTGKVLIAGGGTATAELYDPGTGRFTSTTGSMTEARRGHTATLLANSLALDYGKVLVAGADGTADLYDPGTGTFAPVGDMPSGGSGHTASFRNDGTVLVAGFTARSGPYYGPRRGSTCPRFYAAVSRGTAEVFAPESEGFTATGSLGTARNNHAATVLADGSTVLITGGVHDAVTGVYRQCNDHFQSSPLPSAELYK